MDFRFNSLTLAAAALFALTALQPANAQTPPTDPRIVGIVIGANTIDINYGNLALSKTKDKQIRDFAQQMVTDHTAVQKSVMDPGAKLHVTPADSPIADSLKKQAAETVAKLKGLSGKAFDKAYVDNEVAYHTAVIDVVSKTLIPNARNAEVKAALTGAAPLFVGHLDHAKMIQSKMRQAA